MIKLLARSKWKEAGKRHKWELMESNKRYWDCLTINGKATVQEVSKDEAIRMVKKAMVFRTGRVYLKNLTV